jgi:dGTP triphosphohydrolase
MEEVIEQLQPILATLLIAVLTWGATELTKWIRNKTQSERVASATDEVTRAIIDSVKEIEQTMRPMLTDGELSASEKLKLKEAAMKSINNKVRPEVLKVVGKNVQDMTAWLNSKVEATVLDVKKGEDV